MIKKYTIKEDPKQCNGDKALYKMRLTLNDKINTVLKGIRNLIFEHDNYEIWKVKLPYEIKLVLILKKSEEHFLIIESIAINSTKKELLKMQVEFNTCLKEQRINKIIQDINRY
jgi:intracellular sulfur oxidation DsrE/DsrF family protein